MTIKSYSKEWFDQFRLMESAGKLRRTVAEIAANDLVIYSGRALRCVQSGDSFGAYAWGSIAASCASELSRAA